VKFDVAVLGLGGMGSAAAYHLSRRGLRVLGLEQFTPAHDRGASHGGSRIIRQAYWEHPDYVPLLLRAYELWHELEKSSGRSLFLKTGGLMIGDPNGPIVKGSIVSAQKHGLPHEVLSTDELRRKFPTFQPRNEIALYEENAGVLFPEECVKAHLDGGATLKFGVRVDSLDEIPADRIVITAGPWARHFLPQVPLKVEQVAMHWFDADVQIPIFIWDHPERAFYGFPSLPGQGFKVAFHHSGVFIDPDAARLEVDIEPIRRRLAETMPSIRGKHLNTSTCLYTNTPDEHFVIGTRDRFTFAAGFSGHGFKFASVIGEILADLAMTGRTRHPIGLFNPARFTPSCP
jgi:sarcosine oxidase